MNDPRRGLEGTPARDPSGEWGANGPDHGIGTDQGQPGASARVDAAELERLIENVARAQPARRAPASLQGRVFAQISAQPWWRRGFTHWPMPARAAFLVASLGFIKLALVGFISVVDFVHSSDVAGVSALHRTGEAFSTTVSLGETVFHSIPATWLYAGAAVGFTLYAAFYNTPACGVTTAVLESYSSQGGTPILFDTSGTRLATPTTRQKPNFVAPDGGNDTFLGFKDTGDKSAVAQCANNSSYPNFFGTSAAAPHAAAIAALMFQVDSTLTPAQIYGALQSTALPMANTSPDANTGYGFIQADAAYSSLGLGAPPVTVASTPSSPGSKGGGGGAIDGVVLFVLGSFGLARLLQQRCALGSAHDRRTGNFVVPALPVVVNGNPDKTQAHYGER